MRGKEGKGKERGNGPLLFTTIAALMRAVPVLYFLSVGPVLWLDWHGYMSRGGTFYAPLQWAADHCEPFNRALHWYMGLFVPGA